MSASQRPETTRVAGFQTWKSLGRFVKKGERGIRIFAPIVRKVEEERNGTTEQVSRPVGFRSIAVFAIEQTEGEPLPEINSNASEGGEDLLPRLEAATAVLNATSRFHHPYHVKESGGRDNTGEIKAVLQLVLAGLKSGTL